MLHEIVYASRATGDTTRDDLRAILASAHRHNAEVGITGLLLYSDASFLQVLEGDEGAVRSTFARIAEDPRHDGVRILADRDLVERRYPRWTMGFDHLDAARVAELVPGAEVGRPLAAVVDGDAAERILADHRAHAKG